MDELFPPCSLPFRLRAWIRRTATAVAPTTGDHGRCSPESPPPVPRPLPLPLLDEAKVAARRPGSLPLLAGDEAKVAAAPATLLACGETRLCTAVGGEERDKAECLNS
uniref:Uncharacterized protein n=1 Tax=Oryza rufipogon TaxID=4529 RepID=A0A0E0R7Y9_ORYRU